MSRPVIIKPLAKGQITIPVAFREALQIKENTLLKADLRNNGIFIEPLTVNWEEKYVREFSKEELSEFLKEDKLDKKTLKKIKRYLQ